MLRVDRKRGPSWGGDWHQNQEREEGEGRKEKAQLEKREVGGRRSLATGETVNRSPMRESTKGRMRQGWGRLVIRSEQKTPRLNGERKVAA